MPLGLLWLSITSQIFDLSLVIFVVVMAIGTFTAAFIYPSVFEFCFRFSSYFLAAVLLLSSQKALIFPFQFAPQVVHRYFWGSIALAVVIYHLITRFSTLKDTTLDYIILFIVIILPFLPVDLIGQYHLGTVAGGMIVFFWASDLLLVNQKGKINFFSVLCFCSVIIMLIRIVVKF